MGFYGKVEHTDRLNFVIDKVYPNRKEMDANVNTDEVFIGRYVLIEYEQKGQEVYLQLYKNPETMDFYFDPALNVQTRAKYTEDKDSETGDYFIELHEIIYVLDEEEKQRFYKCNGKTSDGFATFVALSYTPSEMGTYHNNYQTDIDIYGESRGFDSTVWQKIYVDDTEKYAMIAELNSVVPTFDITLDAPTINPIPPHFDADSNNVYYKLHMQPTWGFKIKEATGSKPSDTNVTAVLTEWDKVNNTLNKKYKNYKGAIYFNRDGFDPDYHYDKNDNEVKPTDNYIQFSTEASGQEYNMSHGAYTAKQDDIQALEIMLPGIGRALSELWDLAYGKGEVSDEENRKIRNKDVKWDSMTGLRLVKTSRNPEVSGFEYDTVSIDTIAGCINSVHDLIGMIIVNDKDEKLEIDDALVNRIYYRDGQYWIKDLTYKYVEVSNEDQKIENIKQFGDNYYYKNGNNYYKELEGYQAGNQYYEFNDNVVTNVTLCQEVWAPNTYYYFEDNNYKLDPNDYPDETKTYFKISQNLNDVKVKVNNQLTGLCFYPTSYTTETYNALFPTVKASENVPGKGLFYTGKDATGKTGYLPYEQGKVSPMQTPLHYWDGYQIEISTTTSGQFIETYEFGKATDTQVQMVQFKADTFYYQDAKTKDWILLEKEADIDLSKTYYQFGEDGINKVEINGKFYEPNLYHYLDYVDYIMDSDEEREPGIDYYYINEEEIKTVNKETVFYEPNKYFYFNGTEYVIDTAEKMTEGREYFKDIYTRYIHPDSKDKTLIPGSIWNEAISVVPPDVKLANREETYQWKKLDGFSRSLNTINGLILKINNVLKLEDNLTRDPQTIQGCINNINDIINRIDALKPSHFIAVDEYGRMTSMEQETDAWIDIKINKDNNDKVIITHIGPVISNETKKDDLAPKFGDTFTIEDWYFDDKGHKSNKTTHTVKIPQGSLTDTTKTGSDLITQLSFDKPTGALTSTRENLSSIKLAGYTKSTDNADVSEGDTLGQALSKLQTQIIEEETNRANIINALDMSNEDTAHFISKITQTDGQVAIERAAAGTLKIADENGSYSVPETSSKIDKQDTLAVAFGKVEAQINTANTTRANEVKTLTDNLNKEIQDRKDAISSAIFKEVQDRDAAILVETNARIKAINDLDATITTETSEIITSITQTDGLVSAGKKKIGDIALTGWSLGENVVDSTPIADTDNVFNAFAKTQRQINANKTALAVLNGNSTTQGSVAYQIAQIVNENNNGTVDTLNEIAAWIITDTTGTATMNANIKNNADAIDALELLVGNTEVATQIANAINTALTVEGKSKYALATDLINLSAALDNINGRVEKLENAVSTEKIAKWDAAVQKEEYNVKIAELEQADYTLNSRCNVLDKEVKNLINLVAELQTKIAELEAQ